MKLVYVLRHALAILFQQRQSIRSSEKQSKISIFPFPRIMDYYIRKSSSDPTLTLFFRERFYNSPVTEELLSSSLSPCFLFLSPCLPVIALGWPVFEILRQFLKYSLPWKSTSFSKQTHWIHLDYFSNELRARTAETTSLCRCLFLPGIQWLSHRWANFLKFQATTPENLCQKPSIQMLPYANLFDCRLIYEVNLIV